MQRLLPSSPSRLPGGLDAWAGLVSALFDVQRARAVVKAANESADVRRVSIQVVDRKGDVARQGEKGSNRFLVHAWISTSYYGAPDGSQNVAVATGQLVRELEADRDFLVVTNDTGLVQLDVEVTGAGTRHVMAAVLSEVDAGVQAGFTWAA